ncbi:ABC transporter permease [Phyllobacterium brassicacearum]|uniref:ABC transporter permease n=1 Tax=Phyllobacterium brassicacearum TaxID=314235 RepID=A0A2P7B6G3_9HYPH|nr:amino acid ABC transporter permease [Phyllobacterium brassicacearum]PSH62046.1 ABC transporter permease [Phyllobacterium brassicacearum]
MGYSFDFSVIFAAWPQLLYGCWLTLVISAKAMAMGFAIGLICVVVRRTGVGPLVWLVKAFIEIIRNTPFPVQAFFIYLGLPTIGIRLSPDTAAVIALGLNGGAYAAEIIRGGVESVQRGQIEAGRALGLNGFQVFRYIILRPALRVSFPALASQFILLMLTSSVVASISATELASIGQQLESTTFRSFEVYLTLTALYLGMSATLTAIFATTERVFFSYPTR